jgi:hypothetical protein
LLILGQRHLERVLREYVRHYNRQRPHRGIQLQVPVPDDGVGAIERIPIVEPLPMRV